MPLREGGAGLLFVIRYNYEPKKYHRYLLPNPTVARLATDTQVLAYQGWLGSQPHPPIF